VRAQLDCSEVLAQWHPTVQACPVSVSCSGEFACVINLGPNPGDCANFDCKAENACPPGTRVETSFFLGDYLFFNTNIFNTKIFNRFFNTKIFNTDFLTLMYFNTNIFNTKIFNTDFLTLMYFNTNIFNTKILTQIF